MTQGSGFLLYRQGNCGTQGSNDTDKNIIQQPNEHTASGNGDSVHYPALELTYIVRVLYHITYSLYFRPKPNTLELHNTAAGVFILP